MNPLKLIHLNMYKKPPSIHREDFESDISKTHQSKALDDQIINTVTERKEKININIFKTNKNKFKEEVVMKGPKIEYFDQELAKVEGDSGRIRPVWSSLQSKKSIKVEKAEKRREVPRSDIPIRTRNRVKAIKVQKNTIANLLAASFTNIR